MTEIAVREDTAPLSLIQASAAEMGEAARIAELVCKTAFAPQHFRGKPEDATVAVLYGQTIGMDPMTSLQQLYVIGGKPALYARAMVAIVLDRGHELWTEESSDEKVVVCGRRKGTVNVERVEWTKERARKAGYTSNKKYDTDPQAMLYARASGDVARKIAPDALLGMGHNVEELQVAEEVDGAARITTAKAQRVKPTIIEAAAAVTEPARDLDNLLDAVPLADDLETLRAIYHEAGTLPDAERDTVRAEVNARHAVLTGDDQ